MVQAVNPQAVWAPFGAFSMAVIEGAGQIVHLKGHIALDRDGTIVGRGDMGAQTQKALENIRAVLETLGGRMEDVVSLTQHVTDIDAFMAVGDIRRQFFNAPYPVTTTVEVVRLYHRDLLVEISATAEIPRDRFRMPGTDAGAAEPTAIPTA